MVSDRGFMPQKTQPESCTKRSAYAHGSAAKYQSRRLTISYATDESRHSQPFPMLRLRGFWMKELGWCIGDKVQVRATSKSIVVRKAPLI